MFARQTPDTWPPKNPPWPVTLLAVLTIIAAVYAASRLPAASPVRETDCRPASMPETGNAYRRPSTGLPNGIRL
jgi:hypothetical protein